MVSQYNVAIIQQRLLRSSWFKFLFLQSSSSLSQLISHKTKVARKIQKDCLLGKSVSAIGKPSLWVLAPVENHILTPTA